MQWSLLLFSGSMLVQEREVFKSEVQTEIYTYTMSAVGLCGDREGSFFISHFAKLVRALWTSQNGFAHHVLPKANSLVAFCMVHCLGKTLTFGIPYANMCDVRIRIRFVKCEIHISGHMLKNTAEAIAPTLTHLLNLSLKSGKVSEAWKTSSIVPIPKTHKSLI